MLEEHPCAEAEMQSSLSYGLHARLPDKVLEDSQTHQLLWRCIYALPEISQEILILSYMREMKQVKITEFLGISLTAVRNRMSDARKRLKKEMVRMVEKTIQGQPLAENFTDRVLKETMERGRKALASGDWTEAKEQFRRASDIKEDFAPAYYGVGEAVRGMIEERLGKPEGQMDRQMVEEACTELARAYRLGSRDPETVWTLAKLYHQFQRCEEYVNLLWEFAQTSSDAREAFKAGYTSIFEMGQECIADNDRALKSHKALLEKFDGQVSRADKLDSYIHSVRAYREKACLKDWLEETERLAEQIGDEMLIAQRFFYTRTCVKIFRWLECYQEAISTGEEFVRWTRSSAEKHPHKLRMIIEIQATLLPGYVQSGRQGKIRAILLEAEEIFDSYQAERDSVVAAIQDEKEKTRQRLERQYGRIEDYPAGATVGETREWLDRKYQSAINCALHNLGAACKLIGEGEAAIRLFRRALQHDEKSGRRGRTGNTCTWIAELMLSIRNDRGASLRYLKQAATDRRWVADGFLKRHFERGTAFEPARNDEEFLAVVNAPVVTE